MKMRRRVTVVMATALAEVTLQFLRLHRHDGGVATRILNAGAQNGGGGSGWKPGSTPDGGGARYYRAASWSNTKSDDGRGAFFGLNTGTTNTAATIDTAQRFRTATNNPSNVAGDGRLRPGSAGRVSCPLFSSRTRRRDVPSPCGWSTT